MSRRKLISQQTKKEIKEIAYRLLVEKGAEGLSIRAIAREIDMTPPAIYTYFASLDELITDLIVDTFNDYADALETARDLAEKAGASLSEQLIEVSLSYRNWAVTNPERWKLIYGNPIPGYHGPYDITVPAVRRTANIFMKLINEMWKQGMLSHTQLDQSIPETVAAHISRNLPQDTSSEAIYNMYLLYRCWVHLHGIVTLEVLNHLQGPIGDTEAFYRHEVKQIYINVGIIK